MGVTTITLRRSKSFPPKSVAGSATIVTVPDGAEIRIDDKLMGTTPLHLSLPPGSYSIRATLPEYEERKQIWEVSGKTPTLQLDLQPAKK